MTSKADKIDLDDKADITYVDSELAKKTDASLINSELATKTDLNAVVVTDGTNQMTGSFLQLINSPSFRLDWPSLNASSRYFHWSFFLIVLFILSTCAKL